MHPRLAINVLSMEPYGFDRQVDLVARMGAHAITPDVGQFGAITPVQAGRLIQDAGLVCAALTHRAFEFADVALVPAALGRLERSIAIASELGAGCIVMTTGGRAALDWPDATIRFAEVIAPCVDLARQAGITLGIEPTSHLYADTSIVHSLADCAAVARAAEIGVVNDLFACWVDADIATAFTAVAPLTALVQVSDYIPGDRALPCRAVPGDGAIPLERYLPAIIDTGYAGYFDLEIIGPRLLAGGIERELQRAASHVGGILATAGLPC